MKKIIKIACVLTALVSLASCASKSSSVPSYAPGGGGYITPTK